MNTSDPCFPIVADQRQIIEAKIAKLKAQAFDLATEAVLLGAQVSANETAKRHQLKDFATVGENCRRGIRALEVLLAELHESAAPSEEP